MCAENVPVAALYAEGLLADNNINLHQHIVSWLTRVLTCHSPIGFTFFSLISTSTTVPVIRFSGLILSKAFRYPQNKPAAAAFIAGAQITLVGKGAGMHHLSLQFKTGFSASRAGYPFGSFPSSALFGMCHHYFMRKLRTEALPPASTGSRLCPHSGYALTFYHASG